MNPFLKATPDKVCDRISDEVVDAFYREGAKEGLTPGASAPPAKPSQTTNRVVIAGESRGPKSVTVAAIEDLTRKAIKDIGYEQEGFHWANCNIEVLLHSQSADIAAGVDAQQPTNQKKARATRASCSVTPATRRRN